MSVFKQKNEQEPLQAHMVVSPAELQLLELIRADPDEVMRIYVRDCIPFRVEQIRYDLSLR